MREGKESLYAPVINARVLELGGSIQNGLKVISIWIKFSTIGSQHIKTNLFGSSLCQNTVSYILSRYTRQYSTEVSVDLFGLSDYMYMLTRLPDSIPPH